MVAADATNNDYRDDVANCETNIAATRLLAALGDPAGGRVACDHAIAIRRRLIEGDPENTEYRTGLGESLLRLGRLRRATGDIPGAAADFRREAIAALRGASRLPARVGEIAGLEAGCRADALDPRRPPRLRRLRVRRPPRGRRGHGRAPPSRSVSDGFRYNNLRDEPALDTLRDRPDFRALRMDVVFPADPFADGR